MLKLLNLTFILILCTAAFSQKPNDALWTELLQKHVDPYGKVNYKGFKAEEEKLDEYLKSLKAAVPNGSWRVEEQKAYWINVYNAYTVKLILMHYPLKSIMDIKVDGKDAWHILFINIGDKKYTLDYIENTMLRKQFNDSRIHFAINCSAKSCPPLKNKAYSWENIELELRLVARAFINDERYNMLSANHLQVSQIFNWYKDDFLKEEKSIQSYIGKQSPHIKVSPTASLNFLEYNWSLNE